MKIEIKNISKSFGTPSTGMHPILRDVNVRFGTDSAQEDIHSLVLIGPSGAGKSTLLRLIAGLEYPDNGDIIIDGTAIDFHSENTLLSYRRSIGVVFQSYNLFSHLNAVENLMLPLVQVHGKTPIEAFDISCALLERFGLITSLKKYPSELSGGQKQRVALARAIAVKPRFLLLDEPTSALDPIYTAEVLDMIDLLKAEGMDLILVTHHLSFARHIAEKVVFVGENGLIVQGSTEDILLKPQDEDVKRFLSYVLKY